MYKKQWQDPARCKLHTMEKDQKKDSHKLQTIVQCKKWKQEFHKVGPTCTINQQKPYFTRCKLHATLTKKDGFWNALDSCSLKIAEAGLDKVQSICGVKNKTKN